MKLYTDNLNEDERFNHWNVFPGFWAFHYGHCEQKDRDPPSKCPYRNNRHMCMHHLLDDPEPKRDDGKDELVETAEEKVPKAYAREILRLQKQVADLKSMVVGHEVQRVQLLQKMEGMNAVVNIVANAHVDQVKKLERQLAELEEVHAKCPPPFVPSDGSAV